MKIIHMIWSKDSGIADHAVFAVYCYISSSIVCITKFESRSGILRKSGRPS